jgi:hypothetical protein
MDTWHDQRPTHRTPEWVTDARATSVFADKQLDEWISTHLDSMAWTDSERAEFNRLYEARDAAYLWMLDIVAIWNQGEIPASLLHQSFIREGAEI